MSQKKERSKIIIRQTQPTKTSSVKAATLRGQKLSARELFVQHVVPIYCPDPQQKSMQNGRPWTGHLKRTELALLLCSALTFEKLRQLRFC